MRQTPQKSARGCACARSAGPAPVALGRRGPAGSPTAAMSNKHRTYPSSCQEKGRPLSNAGSHPDYAEQHAVESGKAFPCRQCVGRALREVKRRQRVALVLLDELQVRVGASSVKKSAFACTAIFWNASMFLLSDPKINCEMAFAKLKALLRARAVRTIDALWRAIVKSAISSALKSAKATSTLQATDSLESPAL